MKLLMIAAAVLAAMPEPASAACHLKHNRAVGCSVSGGNGEDAAEVFEALKFDEARMDQSNIRAVLAESDCMVVVEDASDRHVDFRKIGSRDVPTGAGWVKVDLLTAKGRLHEAVLWIADAYLAGTCERPPPMETTTVEVPR